MSFSIPLLRLFAFNCNLNFSIIYFLKFKFNFHCSQFCSVFIEKRNSVMHTKAKLSALCLYVSIFVYCLSICLLFVFHLSIVYICLFHIAYWLYISSCKVRIFYLVLRFFFCSLTLFSCMCNHFYNF